MARYVENESYLHRCAKETVAGWLRSVAVPDGYCVLDPIISRPNRNGLARGILVEYPFGTNGEGVGDNGTCIYPLWDEDYDVAPEDSTDWCPSPREVMSFGVKLAWVADIVVFHKGFVNYAIEIIHRHPTPPKKIDFFEKHGIQLIEVCASRVMRQTRRPKSLPLWKPDMNTLEERWEHNETRGHGYDALSGRRGV